MWDEQKGIWPLKCSMSSPGKNIEIDAPGIEEVDEFREEKFRCEIIYMKEQCKFSLLGNESITET